jgi:hypothetical protein
MITTDLPAPPIPTSPAGAVHIGEWKGNGPDRGRYFEHAPIRIVDITLSIHGIQYIRGTTGQHQDSASRCAST